MAVVMLSFVSCIGTEKEVAVYNEFTVYPPQFRTVGGQKIMWIAGNDGSLCAFANSGSNNDKIVINGVEFEVYWDEFNSLWKARRSDRGSEAVGRMNDGFFVVFPSDGATFDSENGLYGNVQFNDQNPPMAAFIQDNKVNLEPCGCILNVISSVPVKITISTDDDNGGKFVKSGSIDPINSLVLDDGEDYEIADLDCSGEIVNGQHVYHYLSLPMTAETVRVTEIIIEDMDGNIYALTSEMDFSKGVFYTIDLGGIN